MTARLLFDRRIPVAETAFVELVAWSVPQSVAGSGHRFKYRMALVVLELCVLRYDNERGKGDHIHVGDREGPYRFTSLDRLVADFMSDAARWLDENENGDP